MGDSRDMVVTLGGLFPLAVTACPHRDGSRSPRCRCNSRGGDAR